MISNIVCHRTLLAFLTIACYSFSEPLETHFKKIEGKSDVHKMPNIDFIYMINLDQRPEKFKSCTDQLHRYSIYPYRFSAVNGWELTVEQITDMGVTFVPGMEGGFWGTSYLPGTNLEPTHGLIQNYGQTYFCHCMSRGAIGIVLSHLSILQDAYDSGYSTIWVMEDDIQVIQNPKKLPSIIRDLDNKVGHDKWDILFTDQDTKNAHGNYVPCKSAAKRPNFHPLSKDHYRKHELVADRFIRKGARYGAYSMIVRRSGMKKILDFMKSHKIFLPYDMEFHLPKDIRMYSVKDAIVSTQTKAISDNGGANYLLGKHD
jgi:GR25 family glycosyltransferase involved in LPS biosynthesis